jgi:CubicO group peptidase (beta-lactamase class C family)
MKNKIYILVFCIGLIFTSIANGQVIDRKKLERKIDLLVPKHVNDTTPGLVVGIVKGGELIFSKSYGLANVSYGIPNDTKMVYNIGSVSKQFLGYAFAMLQVEGVLNCNDPVNKYLENWPVFEHEVTIKHLLSHTSGYREAYTMSDLAGRIVGVDRLTKKECLDVVRKQPKLEFIPGSRYTYNSTAWVILAEIIKKVTGETAENWVKQNILKPLQMDHTQIETHVGQVIKNAAESYSYNKQIAYVNPKSNRAIFGGADICTSIEDLVKWVRNYHSGKVGGKAVRDLFFTPLTSKKGVNKAYAFGIGSGIYRGLKYYGHGGSHEAFLTQLTYYPDQDLGIICISNFGRKGLVSATDIADIVLKDVITIRKKKQEVKLKKEQLKQFGGLYVASTKNRIMNLTVSNHSLRIEGRTKLIPTAKNVFYMDRGEAKFQFDRLKNNQMQLTIIDGNKDIYNKVNVWNPNQEELKNFEGDYWSKELETVYHLFVIDGKLVIKHRWLDKVKMEPISQDFFKTDLGYYVNFTRNEKGEIEGLHVSSSRTLDVFFQRKK